MVRDYESAFMDRGLLDMTSVLNRRFNPDTDLNTIMSCGKYLGMHVINSEVTSEGNKRIHGKFTVLRYWGKWDRIMRTPNHNNYYDMPNDYIEEVIEWSR